MNALITHNGYPHADDILSYSVLSFLFPDWILIRTRDEDIIRNCSEDSIVFDIGMKYDGYRYFDHHQKDKEMRDELIPYSAFGLIWFHFGRDFLEKLEIKNVEKVWAHIDETFVRLIDIGDNGVICAETKRVSDPFSFGRIMEFSASASDEDFKFSAIFGHKILMNMAKKQDEVLDDMEYVKGANTILFGTTLVLDKKIASLSSCKERADYDDLLFVIQPRDDKFQVSTLQSGTFVNRMSLKQTEDIPDLEFCHTAGFIAVGKTKESLFELIKQTLGEV